MAENTKIEWTDRSDWNPMRGCTRVSEGCRNCYAERIAGRFSAPGQPFHGFATQTPNGGRWTGKVEMIPDRLDLPLRWRKPLRIFVNSAFDLFHESVPDEWIDQVFAVMALANHHVFQVLTKRAARMREYITSVIRTGRWLLWRHPTWGHDIFDPVVAQWDLMLRHVWLGVSAEDQQRADERIPHLLATPAAVRWVSLEPLLGPIDLRLTDGVHHHPDNDQGNPAVGTIVHAARKLLAEPTIDWVVVGGESGPGARPMHPDWARSLRDQCKAAGVPFHWKQWGGWAPGDFGDRGEAIWMHRDGQQSARAPADPFDPAWVPLSRIGKKVAGRLLDGVEHNGMPGGVA